MNIIVDAMGGDHAPDEIVRGAISAMHEYGVSITLVGDEEKIRPLLNGEEIPVVHAPDQVTMEDEPSGVMREKKEASMFVAMRLLAEGKGDAMVSAGSTGALLIGATLIVKRIKGIRRAAICAVLPTAKGKSLLIDCGATSECTAEYLEQFAVMGAYYTERVLGVSNPRVALVSNGTEAHKGRALEKEAYAWLKQSGLNFIGNVEGRDVVLGGADVLVTDGFTGNVILKAIEGVAIFFAGELKGMFLKSLGTKLAALFVKDGIRSLKKKMDYNETGGAPLIGLAKPVIKAHGSSKALTMKSAIYQAIAYVKTGIIADITRDVAAQNAQDDGKGSD